MYTIAIKLNTLYSNSIFKSIEKNAFHPSLIVNNEYNVLQGMDKITWTLGKYTTCFTNKRLTHHLSGFSSCWNKIIRWNVTIQALNILFFRRNIFQLLLYLSDVGGNVRKFSHYFPKLLFSKISTSFLDSAIAWFK